MSASVGACVLIAISSGFCVGALRRRDRRDELVGRPRDLADFVEDRQDRRQAVRRLSFGGERAVEHVPRIPISRLPLGWMRPAATASATGRPSCARARR
jgi:hypothetical protein